jgi:hypothetical protein
VSAKIKRPIDPCLSVPRYVHKWFTRELEISGNFSGGRRAKFDGFD